MGKDADTKLDGLSSDPSDGVKNRLSEVVFIPPHLS